MLLFSALQCLKKNVYKISQKKLGFFIREESEFLLIKKVLNYYLMISTIFILNI